MTIAIQLTRPCDGPDVCRALAARGLQAEVVAGDGHLRVRADDLAQVERALGAWMAERGLPFVPLHADERTVVLAPPPA